MKNTLEIAPKPIGKHVIEAAELSASDAPEALFSSIEPNGYMTIPDYMTGDEAITVPSLRVETHRHNQAELVFIAPSNPVLSDLFDRTVRKGKAKEPQATEAATKLFFEAATRLIDIPGNNGLHHLHKTKFPGTVYHLIRPRRDRDVYVTQLGVTEGDVPVIGWITATDSPKASFKFYDAVREGKPNNRRYTRR